MATSSSLIEGVKGLSIKPAVKLKDLELGWFCAKCTTFLSLPVKKSKDHDRTASTELELHYSKVETLKAVAKQGCQLCFIIFHSSAKSAYENESRLPDTAIWIQRTFMLEDEDEDDAKVDGGDAANSVLDGGSPEEQDDDSDVSDDSSIYVYANYSQNIEITYATKRIVNKLEQSSTSAAT